MIIPLGQGRSSGARSRWARASGCGAANHDQNGLARARIPLKRNLYVDVDRHVLQRLGPTAPQFNAKGSTYLDYETAASANRATTNAGGMTKIPSFRNCHAVTASPSRLRAISHRRVASEPVTERLGPRSTPINIPLVTCRGASALWLTVAATRPVGRLFIRFEARATMVPAPKEASRGEYAAAL